MLRIIEVKSYKERKKFVDFPLKLYKGNKQFVPPLYVDEMNIFTKKNLYNNTCDSSFFLCMDDKKVVGRIQGIIQKESNKKNNEKRVRFTRFDSINNKEVSRILFDAVVKFGKDNGMDTICGPLGYSDLEREGLLIEGFDERQTFEEQYNYPYYQELIEDYGFVKEVDWLESELKYKKDYHEKIHALSLKTLERNNLHIERPNEKESKRDFINRIKESGFNMIDEEYAELYGTVPFDEGVKKQIVEEFILMLRKQDMLIISDENNNVVLFGFGIPTIGNALQGTKGKLTLKNIRHIIMELTNPKGMDLAIIAIKKEYRKSGIFSCAIDFMLDLLRDNYEYLETNLNLETNSDIRSAWKYFDSREHKKRRCFVKKI